MQTISAKSKPCAKIHQRMSNNDNESLNMAWNYKNGAIIAQHCPFRRDTVPLGATLFLQARHCSFRRDTVPLGGKMVRMNKGSSFAWLYSQYSHLPLFLVRYCMIHRQDVGNTVARDQDAGLKAIYTLVVIRTGLQTIVIIIIGWIREYKFCLICSYGRK